MRATPSTHGVAPALAVAFALACAAVRAPAVGAQAAPPITLQVVPLGDRLYVLRGSTGGNVVVLAGEDGLLLVDAQYARARDSLWAALRAVAPAGTRVRWLIDTHWHRDHAEGNADFGDTVTIVAHEATRVRLATPQWLFGRAIAPLPEAALPAVTFTDSLRLRAAGDTLLLVHRGPAHTDGDLAVYFERAHVADLGDLFLPGRLPFVDLDHGGSVSGMLAAVDDALSRTDDSWRIVPGHGAASGRADLVAYRDMLRTSLATVGDGLRAGRSLAEIERRGLPAALAGWAWQANPESLWIRTVYTDLAANRPAR